MAGVRVAAHVVPAHVVATHVVAGVRVAAHVVAAHVVAGVRVTAHVVAAHVVAGVRVAAQVRRATGRAIRPADVGELSRDVAQRVACPVQLCRHVGASRQVHACPGSGQLLPHAVDVSGQRIGLARDDEDIGVGRRHDHGPAALTGEPLDLESPGHPARPFDEEQVGSSRRVPAQ